MTTKTRQELFEEACKLSMRVRESFAILQNPLALYADPQKCVEYFENLSKKLQEATQTLITETSEHLKVELDLVVKNNKETLNAE